MVASGVLYHMTNPVRALQLMASASPNLMLWTHYFDQKQIEKRGLSRFCGPIESRSYEGLNISLARLPHYARAVGPA